MPSISRRSFLQAAAVTAALPAHSWARVLGANSDLRVAVVGLRSRGNALLGEFSKQPGVRIVALCDVDSKILARRRAECGKKGFEPDALKDVRRVVERDDVDVVVIATPNHWHSLMAIWAVENGKDVYVEKPVSHNVWEGRQLVLAARRHGRIVQAGTQSRTNPGMREAMAYLHDGNLGKVKLARGLCYKPRQPIGKVDGPQTVPDHIDYDLWLGPAPDVPLRRRSLHYDWHWDFATGNGDLGNQGIHQVDLCRWALQEPGLAPRVFSIGGRLGYDDDGNTPNSQIIVHEYERAPLIFEVRGLPKNKAGQAQWGKSMDKYRQVSIGLEVECEQGSLLIASYGGGRAYDPEGNEIRRFGGGASHVANFVEAVRARNAGLLNADILEGHVSSALCHLGNVSYQVGQPMPAAAIRERLADDAPSKESFERLATHLEANEVDLTATPLHMGPALTVDTRNETIVGHEAANRLMTREYREPFTVRATRS